jgi:hypothetical protein
MFSSSPHRFLCPYVSFTGLLLRYKGFLEIRQNMLCVVELLCRVDFRLDLVYTYYMDNIIKIESEGCLIKGCLKSMKDSSRGLCVGHRATAGIRVKNGKTTWEELEVKGLARRKFTSEENKERRKHTQQFKRYI